VLEFFQHQRWAEFGSLATVGHRASERAVGSQASSRSRVDVVACVLRWAFDLFDLFVLACRRRVSRVELMSGEVYFWVGRGRRRCRLGEVAVGSDRSSATGWLAGWGDGGGGVRFDSLVLGWTLDTGRWMLERLNSSWPPGLLASQVPAQCQPIPPDLKGHRGPPRPTSDQAPLCIFPTGPLPQDMLGAQLAQRRTRPWNRGNLECLLIGSLPAGLSAGVGHWTRDCAGVPDSPPGFTTAVASPHSMPLVIYCTSTEYEVLYCTK